MKPSVWIPGLLWPALPLALIGLTTPLTPVNAGFDVDGRIYAAIAAPSPETGALGRTAPWCWRVLTPWLAARLPFDLLTNFRVLAVLAGWLSLLLLYGLLRGTGLTRRGSLLGCLLYAGVFWTLKFAFYSPAYIDAVTQAFLLGVLCLMVHRVYWPIPLLLGIGALQKETMLFLAPVVYAHIARSNGWFRPKSLLWLAAFLIPPIVALIAVHQAIAPANAYHALEYYSDIFLEQTTRLSFWPRFLWEMFSGLGLLPLLLLARPRETDRFFSANPHWLILIGIGLILLFGGIDKARLFLFLLPALVVFAAHLLEPELARKDTPTRLWLAATILLHLYLGHHLSPMTHDSYLTRMVPLNSGRDWTALLPEAIRTITLLALWGLFTAWLFLRRRSLPNPGISDSLNT